MKRKRVNKQKMTKKNRHLGLEHVNISTKKVVPASMGIRCGSDKCAKLFKRECQKVSGDEDTRYLLITIVLVIYNYKASLPLGMLKMSIKTPNYVRTIS